MSLKIPAIQNVVVPKTFLIIRMNAKNFSRNVTIHLKNTSQRQASSPETNTAFIQTTPFSSFFYQLYKLYTVVCT